MPSLQATLRSRSTLLTRPLTVRLHRFDAPPRNSIRHFVSQNNPHGQDTIYALSTAPGRAAIAVVRVSGPDALHVYQHLCPEPSKPPPPRHAVVRSLYTPHTKPSPTSVLDPSAIVLYFDAPKTVTGEHVLELHLHGGPATVKAILAAIPKCAPAIRYAEPGEFTRRAFINHRLDLTQVEALADMLSATTEQQRRLSVLGTTSKSLTRQYDRWRRQLLLARAELEALIDFSEDQHFDQSPLSLLTSVACQVRTLKRSLDLHASNALKGELLRDGIAIVLLGAPNAGKSSLLNRIVGREAAIVSPEAGTTRDVIEVSIDLGGYLVRFADTAGLRDTDQAVGVVERQGISRARAKAQESHLVIIMLSIDNGRVLFDPEVIKTARQIICGNVLVLVNKMDLKLAHTSLEQVYDQVLETAIPGVSRESIHCITCKPVAESPDRTRPDDGIQTFLNGLISRFEDMTSAHDGPAETDPSLWHESLGATQRHRLLLQQASDHLARFVTDVGAAQDSGETSPDIVLAAEHLRSAATCLSRITGRGQGSGDVEEVLGVVFEKFCVGK